MLSPGQRALMFPSATLKARTAQAPLGHPLFSSLLSSFLLGQTPRRSSQGVKKQVSEPAPISLLSADVRLSPPVSWGRLSRLRRPLLSRSFCASWSSPLLCSLLLLVSHGRSQFSTVCLSSACVQGGGQTARLFAIGTRLEVDLVGAFWSTLTTVSGKASKRTFHKWSKGGRAVAAVAAVAISIGAL